MDTLHAVTLAVHIAGGVLALGAGPLALFARARRRELARAYVVAVAVVCVSAMGLALETPNLWWLIPFALGTAAVTAAGVREGRRGGRWSARHTRLVGASYVALVTATTVVSWGGLASWLLPVAAGTLANEAASLPAARAWLRGQAPIGSGA